MEFWIWESGDCYKCEVRFEDVLETVPCCVDGVDEINAFLLRVNVFTHNVFVKVL